MEAYFIPAAIAIGVFVIVNLLIGRMSGGGTDNRKRKIIGRLTQETDAVSGRTGQEDISIIKEQDGAGEDNLEALLRRIPVINNLQTLVTQSGFKMNLLTLLLIELVIFLVLGFVLMTKIKIVGLLIAAPVAWFVPKKYLAWRIRRRNDQFVDMFPDAVDMIVRSVRSGHPVNAAFRMIAENMDAPVAPEFKQVVDEIAYGRSLPEALQRMAKRIGESDLNFFVVVLSVQQETGGNLAEVLSNLSNIIRKRKQLRMKIRAMTSEGRITAWILGALPVIIFGVIYISSPDYLNPLFDTLPGNFIFGTAVGMIVLCMWIVNKMVQIDI